MIPLALLGTLIGGVALASDEAFRIDPVFVSVFRADDPEDESRARAVEGRLAAALADKHLVIPVEEVPAFEDYSAEVYLRACPLDRLAGCAYVIAGRAGADWAVDGKVTFIAGDTLVETSIVDVVRSRTVVTFQTRVEAGREEAWASAVAGMIDQLSAGGDPKDLRGPVDGSGQGRDRARLASERAAIAEGLATLTEGMKAVEIRREGEAVRPARLSAEDLQRYQEQEVAPPWERLGLTPEQYRQMRNRGLDVQDYRARRAGRRGRIVFRGALGGGLAPSRITYDGRWVVDPETQDVLGLEATQRVIQGGGFGGELEIGLGLLPWLDLSVGYGSWGGTHDWLVHFESQRNPREAPARTQVASSDQDLIARLTIAPFPLGPARPLAIVGVSAWRGPSVGRMIDFSTVAPLQPPPTASAIRLRIGIGGELDLDRRIRFFGRAEVLPTIGAFVPWSQEDGDPSLISDRDERQLRAGLGGMASVGIVVLSDPLWGRPKGGGRGVRR